MVLENYHTRQHVKERGWTGQNTAKTKRALTLRCAAAVAAFFWPRVAVGRVLEIITVFQS